MRKTLSAGALCLALSTALLLPACNSGDEDSPKPPAPQPGDDASGSRLGEPVNELFSFDKWELVNGKYNPTRERFLFNCYSKLVCI